MSLTEFLLARIAEDYEVAWGAAPSPWREGSWDGRVDGPREVLGRHGDVTAVCYYGGTYGHVMRFDPTRVLADIDAKRQIVTACAQVSDQASSEATLNEMFAIDGCRFTLCQLAAVYADHPDYRPEWKP